MRWVIVPVFIVIFMAMHILCGILATNNFHISGLWQLLKYHTPRDFQSFGIIFLNTVALHTINVDKKTQRNAFLSNFCRFALSICAYPCEPKKTQIRQVRLRSKANLKRSLGGVRSACNTLRNDFAVFMASAHNFFSTCM